MKHKNLQSTAFPVIVVAASILSGCATYKPPEIAYDDPPIEATLLPEPARPVEVVERPVPLPLPGQLMPVEDGRYPEDELIALRRNNRDAETALPTGRDIALDNLRFRYRIEGDRPPWRPRRAFDDGRQVFIEFPRGIGQGEIPPLFIIGPEGEGQLVNYRIRRNYIIVDRLFAAAELRLGDRQQVVRIVRTDGVRRSPRHEDRGES